MQPLLDVRQLKTYFYSKGDVVKAVDGIDFVVHEGETLAIVGESGCGKSVTSLSVMRLLPKPNGKVVNGDILFRGENLLDMDEHEISDIRGNQISMIFQEPMTSLNPVLTIGKQLDEVLTRHLALSGKEARERSIDMLSKVGFARPEQMMKEYPHQLSGGMRQRVMIAMAMACKPALMIADEPTTALDVTIQAQVLDLMRKMKEQMRTSMILITHDLGVVAEMADRVVVMYAGQVVESTDVVTLFSQPQHPYTKGLLESIPRLDESRDTLVSIQGHVPNASHYPTGCRFAPRCPVAIASCHEVMPELREVEASHTVRCDLVKGDLL